MAQRPPALPPYSYVDELARYGRSTAPASRSPERLGIDFGIRRSVGPSQAALIATQNRSFLADGESGVFRLESTSPSATSLVVGQAVVEHVHARSAPEFILTTEMQRDPVSQNVAYVGVFPSDALEGMGGDVDVRVPVQFEGESFELTYSFSFTGAPPATLQDVIANSITEGDIAFNVALEVQTPGTYTFEGRVINAQGEYVALVTAEQVLSSGMHTATLALDGLFARDWMPPGEYRLIDIEAALKRVGGANPRNPVEPWRGSYAFSLLDHNELRTAPRVPEPYRHRSSNRVERIPL